MKKIMMALPIILILTGAAFAGDKESHREPINEKVLLNLEARNRINSNDLQKMFTALAVSYLKANNSYLLVYEIFRERAKQNLEPSLVVTELDYSSFVITNIRYSFANGYFEFKLSESPFTNIVNGEIASSIDYNGITGPELYKPINDTLQEAVYIARGYATRYKKTSVVSFYIFK